MIGAETSAQSPPRQALVVEYLGLADALARRFRRTGHDQEDLRQVARLGLVKAAQRYREDGGPGFVQYAVPTITGELKRYVRDQSWTVRPPRSLQDLRLKVNALRGRLTQEYGRDPSAAELSEAGGISIAQVAEAQLASAAMVGVPIDDGEPSGDPSESRQTKAVIGSEDPAYGHVEEMDVLSGALADTTEYEKTLIYLRFFRGMTQDEIARTLGVSQMQVSRLLSRLLDRLRRRMDT
ncbi:sigma-70 family RNA polymerase sigma factor [Sinomonas sp. ASV486]|uniref:sigma-70 family RNA polymerase sigma factor n=1 Tax=Sinomonas sp. ASV486 TaxID=3051170 RepID=UPI0027DE7540|nr:sigma-70 family RNA polymerase sigma factor [Sinomonas sp. ASV486]MDQ4492287.1 sigma-70 family RNA polymerase sigma factor [Sinomonas sp. ASV486]